MSQRKIISGLARPSLEQIAKNGTVAELEQVLNDEESTFSFNELKEAYAAAFRSGRVDIIKCLVKFKDLLPELNKNPYYVPLYLAANSGNKQVVSYLINEYPNQRIHTTKSINSAIRHILHEGDPEILRMLVERFEYKDMKFMAENFHFQKEEKRKSDHTDFLGCLKYLLDLGLNPDAKTYVVKKPLLEQAIEAGSLDGVKMLLRRGATPILKYPCSSSGRKSTADSLHSIARSFFYSGSKYLNEVHREATVQITEEMLKTMGQLESEQLDNGVTYAILTDNRPLLALLTKHGAKLCGTHLSLAVHNKSTTLFSILLSEYLNHFSQDDIYQASITALRMLDIETFEVLHSHLEQVDINSFASHFPFYEDRRSDENVESETNASLYSCLNYLLDNKLDPNTPFDNKTLLGRAANSNNTQACRILLAAGANPNQAQGDFPLITAVKARNTELTQLLLDHGADKNVKDSDGKTAEDIANKRRYAEIIDMLTDHITTDELHHSNYYLHFGMHFFSMYGGEIAAGFAWMNKRAELIAELSGQMKANCSLSKLNDYQQREDQHEPDNIFDLDQTILSSNCDVTIDLYVDCEDLDKETVLKAVELLNDRHYVNEDSFKDDKAESEGIMLTRAFSNPVPVILNAINEARELVTASKNTKTFAI